MAEIERKFLLEEDGKNFATNELSKLYPSMEALKNDILTNGRLIKQGYLPLEAGTQLTRRLNLEIGFNPAEARLRSVANRLTLTLKGDGTIERDEIEVEIGEALFHEYWKLTAGKRVEKIRLRKNFGDHTIEIDLYKDRHLTVAEIESPTIEDAESIPTIGLDVTTNPKYKNKNLAK